MVWVVYKASFTTKRGTRRFYFGCTRNPKGREEELQDPDSTRQPAWLKAGCQDFSYKILVPDCRSKEAALATEALATAHSWRHQPLATRGGPWVLPTLPAADTRELQAAAACKNFEDGATPRS